LGIVATVDATSGNTSTAGDGFRVVVAGSSVAGLEALLALQDLGGDRVERTLLSPADQFVYRPMTVLEPFAYPRAFRYPVAEIAADIGAELKRDALDWVAPQERLVHTTGGDELPYDALLLAVGARWRPAYEHALTIDPEQVDELFNGLIQDIEGGYTTSVAFLAAPHLGWPLPLYELALMTARRASEMQVDVQLTVVTPEDRPLAIFGDGAATAVAKLLDDAGIATIASAYASVPEQGVVTIRPGGRSLEANRIVALPALNGPAMRGIPVGEHGFIPIDVHGAVPGVERVFAAGDATDFPIKHGGIAAQQADAAATAIAALAGADVTPEPFRPVIQGILLTGGEPRYLMAKITGGAGFSSEVSDEPLWDPPTKIAARYLAPYLAARDKRHGVSPRD
jgi:sulfide:quinone oxidoreductase